MAALTIMRKQQLSLLRKSVDILHSSLLFVVISCVLHVCYVETIKARFFPPLVTLALMVTILLLKVFIFSGIYGSLLELLSQEQPAINKNSFIRNAKTYWKLYALLLTLSFNASFLFNLFFNHFHMAFMLEKFFFDLPLLYAAAFLMIDEKYRKKLALPKRKILVTKEQVLIIIALFILNGLIVNCKHFLLLQHGSLSNEPIVIYTYIHLLTFIYLATIILNVYPEIEKGQDKTNEIYLINPVGGGIITGIVSQWYRGYPPIFATLKALSPKKYCFKEFNRLPWKKRFLRSNKLVAITSFTSNAPESYKIAKEFKNNGSKVVMGGPHVTYLPEEALQFCDSVVVGEAESVWAEVLTDYENHALKKIYRGVPLENYHRAVHQELLASPPAISRDFLETTRGCKYHCTFCTIPYLTKGRLRQKPIAEIVELIKKISPRRYQVLLFIDNNIFADPEYAKELFTALIPLKVLWATQCSIDIAKDEEILKLARQSGCMQLLIGYEITGHSKEKQKGGKFSLAEEYAGLTRRIKKMGISIKAHFIIGFESDNYPAILKMWKYCFSILPHYTVLSVLTPLPGSALYYKLLREDKIVNYNWRYYGLNSLVFDHPALNYRTFNLFFPVIYLIFLATTSGIGLIMSAIMILDAYFFGLRHFLF